ncbi:MAG: molecular chaperone, partial [Pelagerythrobacter marensis]
MKRFYQAVTVAEVAGGWQVMLDGRGIRTAGGAPQIVPRAALAELLAAEWAAQGAVIDPRAFAMRDLADYAIDIVAPDPAAAIAKLIRFAETDTLCYRADPEDALYRHQQAVWEPLLAALEAREGVVMHRVSGVGYRAQPEAT